VFELDHPATQRDKRQRIAQAGIAVPPHVVYVSHDFEEGPFRPALQRAGFDTSQPVFVLWLGVTPYLSEDSVYASLGEIGSWADGTAVVFDYANDPRNTKDPELRTLQDSLAAAVSASGEPFRSYLDTQSLHAKAISLGFGDIEDLGRGALIRRYLPHVSLVSKDDAGGHVVRMATKIL
jgi:methyltransferase (TIGR00027 family)